MLAGAAALIYFDGHGNGCFQWCVVSPTLFEPTLAAAGCGTTLEASRFARNGDGGMRASA